MLSKAQLRSATTADLERLHALIAKELENRVAGELEDRRQKQKLQQQCEGTDAKDKLFYSGHPGTYRWEYRTCGSKARCKKCQAGQKHGPYLYRYFYLNGKHKSEYIKLSELPKHPDAPSRPV